MKLLSILLTALILSACGGGSSTSDDSTELKFTEDELVGNVLVSKDILSFSVIDEGPNDAIGTINLFDNGEYREISLSSFNEFGFTNGEIEVTQQPWAVQSDGDLQFNYDDIGLCTARKESDNGIEVEVSGECQDYPSLTLDDTLVRPTPFGASALTGRDIEVSYDGASYDYSFSDDGFLNVYRINFDGSQDLVNQGSLVESLYEDAVRVDYTGYSNNSITHSLFILLDGSVTSGKLIEMNFAVNDVLRDVHVRNISQSSWGYPISEYYDFITLADE